MWTFAFRGANQEIGVPREGIGPSIGGVRSAEEKQAALWAREPDEVGTTATTWGKKQPHPHKTRTGDARNLFILGGRCDPAGPLTSGVKTPEKKRFVVAGLKPHVSTEESCPRAVKASRDTISPARCFRELPSANFSIAWNWLRLGCGAVDGEDGA